MEPLKLENLNLLLKAPAKDVVVSLCNEAFLHRDTVLFPESVVKATTQKLSITDAESTLVLSELRSLVKRAVFVAASDSADVAALFPAKFHKNLLDLLVRIITERLPQWKMHASNNLVFLPRLVDFDWRTDVKTSSDTLSRMSVPTCLLQLQVQEPVTRSGVMPPTRCVNVELSRQTLDTMLDGLGKIREQLSSVASR